MFERQFRNRFKPDGDGFLYRSWLYGSMRFSHDEVEEFVRLRRRVWSNQYLWGLVLVAGVAAPLWFLARGGADTALYAGLCLLPGLLGPALLLLWVETAPGSAASDRQAAQGKLVDGTQVAPPSPVARVLYWTFRAYWLAYCAYEALTTLDEHRRLLSLGVVLAILSSFAGDYAARRFARRPRL